jgi:hypothetical protein
MEFKEQGRYGHPESGVFGKCQICGRPIDKRLERCLRCRGSRTLGAQTSGTPAPRSTRLKVLLLLALLAAGLYGLALRLATRRAEAADGPPVGGMPAAATAEAPASPSVPPASTPPIPFAKAVAPARAPRNTTAPDAAPEARTPPVALHPSPTPTAPASVPPPPASRPASTARLTTDKVTCPVCEGRGRIAYEPPRSGGYTCPVCAGNGSRTRRYLSANWRLCDHCGGMGCAPEKDDLFRTRNRMVKKMCPKCTGRGLLPTTKR